MNALSKLHNFCIGTNKIYGCDEESLSNLNAEAQHIKTNTNGFDCIYTDDHSIECYCYDLTRAGEHFDDFVSCNLQRWFGKTHDKKLLPYLTLHDHVVQLQMNHPMHYKKQSH